MTIVPVVLNGGNGARLWPLSRASRPKPFIELPDGTSSLAETYRRALSIPSVSEIVTVTNAHLAPLCDEVFGSTSQSAIKHTQLIEPDGRNSAAAIAAANLYALAAYGTDVVICVFPADHLIDGDAAFFDAINQGVALAEQNRIVTFGIKPDRPETGYGYIEAKGDTVIQFVEKPDVEHARRLIRNEAVFWNSGIFCFRAAAMIDEMWTRQSSLLEVITRSFERSTLLDHGMIGLSDDFLKVQDQSIDIAIMEKTERAGVVPCTFGWRDIGDWNAYGEIIEPDGHGNHALGNVVTLDAEDLIVIAPDRLVAVAGVDNLIIADTPDALLIASRDRAQDVKLLFNILGQGSIPADDEVPGKVQNSERHGNDRVVLDERDGIRVSRIEIRGDAGQVSVHEAAKDTVWTVASGRMLVDSKGTVSTLEAGHSVLAKDVQGLSALGVQPLIIIEIRTL